MTSRRLRTLLSTALVVGALAVGGGELDAQAEPEPEPEPTDEPAPEPGDEPAPEPEPQPEPEPEPDSGGLGSFGSVAATAVRGESFSVAAAPDRVVFISDSALAGIRWNGQLGQLTNSYWETYLESCRRLSSRASCRGREGYAPRTARSELESIRSRRGQAGEHDLLVIGVGYNDWHSTFRTDFHAVNNAARAGGFNSIVWITLREENTYVAPGSNGGQFSNYRTMNAIMREELASGAWPEVQLWEWDEHSDGQSAWFTRDGVHLTTTGAFHAARWFSDQILYVNTPRPTAS